jgi:hypothetical protein
MHPNDHVLQEYIFKACDKESALGDYVCLRVLTSHSILNNQTQYRPGGPLSEIGTWKYRQYVRQIRDTFADM